MAGSLATSHRMQGLCRDKGIAKARELRITSLARPRDGAGAASAKLVCMSEGLFSSCTAAKACAVRSHDQGAWVWRRRS